MARNYRACIIGLLGVVGVLHIMYLVFAKATVTNLNTKMHPTDVGGWIIIWCIFIILLSPPQYLWGVFWCSNSLLSPWQILNT
jgi:hypothetical protein